MRLQDGGFESGGAGTAWIQSGQAVFSQAPDPVHSGAWAMALASSRSGLGITNSMLRQTVPTHPGELLAIFSWFYANAGAASLSKKLQLLVDVNPGDGSNLTIVDTITPSNIGGGLHWGSHIHPPVTTAAYQATLAWSNPAPAAMGSAIWSMDDVAIVGDEDVAKRSRWLAHQRLVTILKGINGVGYHTDLQNRVFTKYIRPVGSTHPALPYICVPLVNTRPRLMDHEQDGFRHYWTLPIMLFVAETNVGAYDSNAIATLYHLTEDVYQVLKRDPLLAGTVASVSFLDGGIEEGGISPFDGLPYADSIIPIELSIVFGLDVLGP